MSQQIVKRVVIAGGGTAGWCAAAALVKVLGPLLDITLVESDDIGIVGVGESTIPTVRTFHQLLDIDEREFLRATDATFKLGIAFDGWKQPDTHYFHSFGELGTTAWGTPFYQIWLQARDEGYAGPLEDYCYELRAALANKFETSADSGLHYAYHLDATVYGQFLRRLSERNGVRRIEGKISGAEQDPETGFVTALVMESGARVEGDLFIDCTGFRALLIGQTLGVGYEDWGHWLPTDRALAVQTESHGPLTPFTRAVAHDAGWRWRIPLQSRVGNGLVYCSQFMSDDEAKNRLADMLDAPTLIEPRLIRYRTGRRLKMWDKNVIAMGLSSGFVEPLESTSIHLFQIGVTRLMQLFPFGGITDSLAEHYNQLSRAELERVRDFVILHYKATQRDSPFWQARRNMEVPDSLAERIGLFVENGIAYHTTEDLFRAASWIQVMLGQGLTPKAWPLVEHNTPPEVLRNALVNLKGQIDRALAAMPTQEQFLNTYLAQPAVTA